MIPNPAVSVENNGDSKLSTSNGDRRVLDYENEFWKQPDGLGSSHALISAMSTGERVLFFSFQYCKSTSSGETRDIFDLERFKSVLANDVKIVSLLPANKIVTRPTEDGGIPFHASLQWIRSHYLKRFKRDGVLLKEFDSRLSRDLPSDLQKLCCKVAFEALKFSPRVMEMGMKLAERMRSKGPYIVLHLWLEKDVWVRTGCLTGLSSKYDEIARIKGIKRPELLTAKSDKLLRALGALRDSRIYWAGREPLGGKEALKPLTSEFPHL
ncbi:hypothetical protein Bca4012_066306 [Brassica carinata]